MARASVAVRVDEDAELRDLSVVDRRGAPRAWLDIGTDSGVGLYGSPEALWRLSAALRAAALRAERLAHHRRAARALEPELAVGNAARARAVPRS